MLCIAAGLANARAGVKRGQARQHATLRPAAINRCRARARCIKVTINPPKCHGRGGIVPPITHPVVAPVALPRQGNAMSTQTGR